MTAMEYLPPQFVLLAKRLSVAIQELKEAVQQQTKAVTESTEATNRKYRVSTEIPVRAEVNLPQGVEIRKKTADAKEDKQYQSRALLVAWLTLAAVVIYALISACQLYEMRRATNAATKSVNIANQTMLLDERAWVGVPSISGTKPEVGKKLTFSVHFTNTGKSPARNLIVYPGDEILRKDQSPNFSNETKQVSLGVLSPGSERTYENFVPMRDGDQELTQVAIDFLKTQVLSVHGKITYDDIFGCHHWVTYAAYLREDWSGYSFYSENNDTDSEYQPCESNRPD
jgi:hypothetical protein